MASVTFPVGLGGNGLTYTDDANATTGLANGGHRTRFVPCLSQTVIMANSAATSATNAAASAASAASAVSGHLADTDDAHDASAISTTGITGLLGGAASNVQAILAAFKSYVDGAFAPLASPALTGTPTAPTAAPDTNTTQVATTAFVVGQAYAKLASPTFTGTPAAPTAAVGTNTTQIATTAFVQARAPLTTKGDLLAFASAPARLAVGSDDQVLVADSSAPNGVAWKTARAEVNLGTYTGTGSYTAAHGLAAQPYMVQVVLRCVATDKSFAVGDEILIPQKSDGTNPIFWASSTQVSAAVAVALYAYDKGGTTNYSALSTASKWSLIAKILNY